MKNLIYPLAAALLLLTSATISVATSDYTVASDFDVKFKSKDPSGNFKKLIGNVKFDSKDLASSSFNFTIPVSSISTGNGMKNKKAQTYEWFDAAKHPKITFVSTKVVKGEKGFVVHGNLKIKGVKRFRKIPLNAVKTKSGWKFTGVFWVDRSYYKVGKPSKTVPNKMKITYSIPVKTKK